MSRAVFTRKFWLDAAERALKSFAQGVVLTAGQDASGIDLFDAQLSTAVTMGLGMAALSLLTSIISAPATGISPASLVPPGA